MSEDERPEESYWFNERLLETRTILLSGRVDDHLTRLVTQSLLLLESEDPKAGIDILVNSGGGSVTAGFAIYDAMRFVKNPIRCISAGLTGSIATIIYCAVEKENRLSLPNSRLLIHQPLIPFHMQGNSSDLQITADEIIKTRRRLTEVLSEACGQTFDKVKKDCRRDYWMSAEEAMEYGMVGRIVASRAEL